MRYTLFVLLLAVTTTVLRAQPLAESSSFSGHSLLLLKAPSFQRTATLPGERMQRAGRILTIAGSAMLIGGIAMVSSAESTYYNVTSTSNGTYKEGDPQGAVGVLMIVGGAGMVIPGIILWSKGSRKYKAAIEESQNASLHLRPNGLAIRYSF